MNELIMCSTVYTTILVIQNTTGMNRLKIMNN